MTEFRIVLAKAGDNELLVEHRVACGKKYVQNLLKKQRN